MAWTRPIFDTASALAGLKHAAHLRGLIQRLQALPPTAAMERLKIAVELKKALALNGTDSYITSQVQPAENAAVTDALVSKVPADYANPYPADAAIVVYGARKSGREVYAAVRGPGDAFDVLKVRNMRRLGQADVYRVKTNTAAIAAAKTVPGLAITEQGGKFVAYFPMLADEKAAKAAEVAAKEAQGGSVEPIRVAVAPMLEAAIARVDLSMREYAERLFAKVAAVDWDFDAAFPRPDSSDPYSYKSRAALRARVSRLFAPDEKRRAERTGYQRGAPQYVLPDPKQIEPEIVREQEAVRAGYEAYIDKLAGKIGPVLEASAVGRDAWSSSVLTVKTVAGETEKWSTQMIINRSIHGTLFNQWPTRKVK